jgi:hypothetical protein
MCASVAHFGRDALTLAGSVALHTSVLALVACRQSTFAAWGLLCTYYVCGHAAPAVRAWYHEAPRAAVCAVGACVAMAVDARLRGDAAWSRIARALARSDRYDAFTVSTRMQLAVIAHVMTERA